MNQSTSATPDEAGMYPGGGNLNVPKRGGLWKYAASGAAGILFLGGLATGYKALKSDYKTLDSSQKDAIVETEGVPEGFGKKPRIEYADTISPGKRINRKIGLPKVSGYTVNDEWISPDFKVNDDYDPSDINDFAMMMIEGDIAGDYYFNRDNVILPGKKFGRLLPIDVERYKIESLTHLNKKEVSGEHPKNARYFQLFLLTDEKSSPGKNARPFLIAEMDKRFYLIDSRGF